MIARKGHGLRVLAVFAALSMLLATLVAGAAQATDHDEDDTFTLTLLHNNDGESQLIDAGVGIEDFGGVARFASQVRLQRADARASGNGSLLLSSGDNFLAGPEFNASLDKGVPFYDTIAIEYLRYDAISFGNHDLDFGPDVLAEFLSGYTRPAQPIYLGANVDFSAEPALQAFVDAGRIAPVTVVRTAGERIGIIGALTPQLGFISSPRNVVVNPDIAGIVQGYVDMLEARGIDKIVFISHLQNIEEDLDLATMLDGVDVMIAGGGDEVLANPDDLLVPNDVVFGPYPLVATDMDGTAVPVITTAGDYKYLGRLDVEFDDHGNVVGWDGGPIRIAGGDNPDAVPSNRVLQSVVVDPVVDYLEDLANNVIATSEVDLNGVRDPGIRTQETGEGDLVADSLLWQAQQLAASFGQPEPVVAVQNGGGIRNNNVIPAGPFTELNTFEIAPFANFVSIAPDIPRAQFKQILENAYSAMPSANGRFAQVAGFAVEYSLSETPMDIDDETGEILVEGTRVQRVVLDDGTVIVDNGAVVDGDPITIASIDFLIKGGDEYPFMGAPFTTLGVTYQQALSNYVQEGLGGVITAAQYPFNGAGRIIESEQSSVATALDALADGLRTNESLSLIGVQPATTGGELVALQYELDGIPVVGAEAVVRIDAGEVTMANTQPPRPIVVDTVASVSQEAAQAAAITRVADALGIDPATLEAGEPELAILDPFRLWLEFPAEPTLTWKIGVSAPTSVVWEVYVNASDATIAWAFDLAEGALDRHICLDQYPCAAPVRTEGSPATGEPTVDLVYEAMGDAYTYFESMFGRDSFDDLGTSIRASVLSGFNSAETRRDATSNWQTHFRIGAEWAADDVAAHEYTHAVTWYSPAGPLRNTVQSGAIEEGLSDIFGEFIDWDNGLGADDPAVRWLIGEDIAWHGRNLKDPLQNVDPTAAAVGDQNWIWSGSNEYQNMGVLTRFGYLITDGEGDIRGLGQDKAARIIFAAAQSLTSGASFAELSRQLQTACANLSSAGVTTDDCEQVDRALREVNMVVDPPAHPLNERGYIARDPYTGRAVLVSNGVKIIGSGDLFNCLAETRIVWDIPNLAALVEPVNEVQISCFDAGPKWTFTPEAAGGNVGTDVILRNSSVPGNNWLINSTGAIQAIVDGGSYLCLARTNPVIWNVPDDLVAAWGPVGDSPATCGPPAALECSEITVVPNDDGSSAEISLPMTIDFGGQIFSSAWVNNNGNVTFEGPMSTYTPFDLTTTGTPLVAPFFADVDTRPTTSGLATAGATSYEGRRAFCANWDNVGYFPQLTDKTNSFQMFLVDRSDVTTGAFDIVFNYTNIEWETGNASGGSNGFGGVSAAVGYSNGQGLAFELTGSRVPGSFLNDGPYALVEGSNVGRPGRYVWEIRP